MEQATTPEKPKAKARKEVSGMRKLTSELDAEARKVESSKLKLAKLEKTIAAGNDRIRTLTTQLAKHFS
jgi:septal ring factor EnvC (AmiA/AmiB activator)